MDTFYAFVAFAQKPLDFLYPPAQGCPFLSRPQNGLAASVFRELDLGSAFKLASHLL